MLQVFGIDHGNDVDEAHPNHYRDRCGGLIAWADLAAAKKWPSQPPRRTSRQLDISSGKWSASIMADRIFRLDRRELVTGLGAAVLSPALPRIAAAQGRRSLTLQAQAGVIALRPGEADTPTWSLLGPPPDISLKRGDELTITVANELPVAATLNWHGLDGVQPAEPLAARVPLSPGARETLAIPLRHAGTFMCDLRLLGDGQARPLPARPLVVTESEPVAVDREQVFLIEDWRLRPDGTAIAPGIDPQDTMPTYTINGLIRPDIPTRTNERLRFRFINGCQRNVIALKIEGHDVR